MLDVTKLKEHRGMALIVIPPENIKPSRFQLALISEYGTLAKGDFLWHVERTDPLLTRQRFPAWGESTDATPGRSKVVLVKPGQKSALTISLATLRDTINEWTEKGTVKLDVTGAQMATWTTYSANARQTSLKRLQTTAISPDDGILITWLDQNVKNKKALKPYTGSNLAAMVEVLTAHHRFDYLNENQLFAADAKFMPGILCSAAAELDLTSAVVKTWRYEGCVKFAEEKAGRRADDTEKEDEEAKKRSKGRKKKALTASAVAASETSEEEDGEEDSEENKDGSEEEEEEEEAEDEEAEEEEEEEEEEEKEEEEEEPRATKRSKLVTGVAAKADSSRDARIRKHKAAGGSVSVLTSPTTARLAKELDAKRARQNAPESKEDLLQRRLDGAEMVIFSKESQLTSLEAQLKVANDLVAQLKTQNARLCDVASGLVPSIQQSIMAYCASRAPGELDDLALYDTIPLERRYDALIALTACLGDDVIEQFMIKVLARSMDVTHFDKKGVAQAVLKVLPDEAKADEIASAWSTHNHQKVKNLILTATTDGSPVQKALLAILC